MTREQLSARLTMAMCAGVIAMEDIQDALIRNGWVRGGWTTDETLLKTTNELLEEQNVLEPTTL